MTSNEAVPSQAIVVDANSTEMTPNESVPSEAVVVEANSTDTIPNPDRAMKTFIGLVDKYSFPLIAISAIAKQNADSLSLFSASETSRIAYSGVSVLGLESKEGNDAAYTTVNVKVLKNRYGQKPTDITLSFDGRYSRFFEFKPVKSTKGKKAAG